jgi:hypothetical protein
MGFVCGHSNEMPVGPFGFNLSFALTSRVGRAVEFMRAWRPVVI